MSTPEPSKPTPRISFDLRFVCLILFVIIVGMLFAWQPWSSTTNAQTVEITGDAKLTAKPDQFVFYPNYQFKNSDRTAALADLSSKSTEITTKLTELGVDSSKVKTSSSGYDYPVYTIKGSNDQTYTLQFTITVDSLDQAQKVQDYLVTTSPTGAVSPQAIFSDAKSKDLENQARDIATKDARTKADQFAQNLGFKIGKVKSVSDNQGFGGIMPMSARTTTGMAEDTTSSLAVQPGENDLNYSVTVVYFIR